MTDPIKNHTTNVGKAGAAAARKPANNDKAEKEAKGLKTKGPKTDSFVKEKDVFSKGIEEEIYQQQMEEWDLFLAEENMVDTPSNEEIPNRKDIYSNLNPSISNTGNREESVQIHMNQQRQKIRKESLMMKEDNKAVNEMWEQRIVKKSMENLASDLR